MLKNVAKFIVELSKLPKIDYMSIILYEAKEELKVIWSLSVN